jgi:hypothetical protein
MKTKREKQAASEPIKRPRRWGNQFQRRYSVEEIERIAEEMIEWFKVPQNLWLKDFSIANMFSPQRISEFEQNEYFAYCHAIAKQMQESKLVKLGISRKVNPSMPIFALKNVAGWKDQQDVNLSASVQVIVDNIPKRKQRG